MISGLPSDARVAASRKGGEVRLRVGRPNSRVVVIVNASRRYRDASAEVRVSGHTLGAYVS